MPDLLTYWLSGERVIEQTIASTSQLLKAGSAEWDLELAAKVGIPAHLLKPVTAPGTKVGKLIASLAAEIGLDSVDVVACGSHDTASAVAGAPARSKNPLFLSSGTWSLLGRELDAPIVTDASFAAGFSNEQGLSGTTRFLKNVAGMWLLQECKRNWDAQGSKLHYGELVDHAWVSKAPGSSILTMQASRVRATCRAPSPTISARPASPFPRSPATSPASSCAALLSNTACS